MNKPRLLQMLRLLPWLEERLQAHYEVVLLPAEASAQPGWLAAHGAGFDGVVTSAAHGLPNAVMDQLPNARIVSSFGVGLDRIDVGHAARRGLRVGYTPDVLNDCVADLAFALLLGLARRIPQADQYVRAGQWGSPGAVAFPFGFKVSGARLGIVGLGRIGRTIARRATGFDMQIRYHSRRPVEGVEWAHEPDLQALARWCDFLVLITAGGPATAGLVDAQVLQALGPEGFLINVARGSVVDEAALLQALQQRRIAGAGLDVFNHEPRIAAEFLGLDNVVLSPHIASSTQQTRQQMGQRVLDNLEAFFAGRPLVSEALPP